MRIPDTLRALAVPIDSVRPYEHNPRRGDLDAIKESLEANGQYRPVVANRRDGTVLAGLFDMDAVQPNTGVAAAARIKTGRWD